MHEPHGAGDGLWGFRVLLGRREVSASRAGSQTGCSRLVWALVHVKTEEALHAALWDALHAGLIFREDTAYKFLHDHIQQCASVSPNVH